MPAMHVDAGIALAFALVADRDRLHLVYRVRNETAGRIHVLDRLLGRTPRGVGKCHRPIALAAANQTVRFALGHVQVGSASPFLVPPSGRALDPGCELSGAMQVSWPLEAWHPSLGSAPLQGAIRRATLEVGVLCGVGKWTQLGLPDGSVVPVPAVEFLRKQLLVAAGPVDLPRIAAVELRA